MHTLSTFRQLFVAVFVLLFAPLLAGCDGGLSGTYTSRGGIVSQTLAFKSGGKVEVTTMGMTQEGEYEVEGKKVRIKGAGATTILTIDDNGCLDGGGMVGKFCKD